MQETEQRPYFKFVREERQFCAVLAHLLMSSPANLESFIATINGKLAATKFPTTELADAEVYVEFARVRDEWAALGRRNDAKRSYLAKRLQRIPSLSSVALHRLPTDIADFNGRLGGPKGARITKDLAYPGKWTLPALAALALELGLGPEAFRDLCRFKWSFGIKPDMVVILPNHSPICVEAKLEGSENSYPTGRDDCGLFDRRIVPSGVSGKWSYSSSCSATSSPHRARSWLSRSPPTSGRSIRRRTPSWLASLGVRCWLAWTKAVPKGSYDASAT